MAEDLERVEDMSADLAQLMAGLGADVDPKVVKAAKGKKSK